MAQIKSLGYIVPMKTILKSLILFISITSFVQAENWRVNWQHSKVSFEIPYMEVTSVAGAFTKFDGAFDFDETSKKLDNIEFVISTNSIDTNNSKRDNHIKNKDFFNVSKYPKIEFKSNKTIYKNNSPVEIIGDLKLLAVTKPVKFKLKYKGSVKDPWDNDKVAQFFEAETTINRKDFGLTWNKDLDKGGVLLGDDVSIKITIEAFQEGVRPAFSRFYLPTKDIKKSVAEDIKSITGEEVDNSSSSSKVGNTAPKVVSTPDLPSGKDMVLNIVFGFIAFVILIGGAIKLQIILTNFLEKKNFAPKWTFLIPNIIVMILIMYIATLLAPYMGYGPHPWGN